MLENLQNYGPYTQLVQTGRQVILNTDINKRTYQTHFNSITNIFRDGIELEEVHQMCVTVRFDVIDVDLYIFDYWFNLIMWQLLTSIGKEIRPKNIFFDRFLRGNNIKKYIDYQFLDENRTKYPNMLLNNIIDDCLWNFSFIDEFSDYIFNTINLEEFFDLWQKFPETYEIMTMKIARDNTDNFDFKTVMPTGSDATKRLLSMIEQADHCLADFVRAGEGLSEKQFKEFAVHIGLKPDGLGNILPYILNTNFLMGGVNNPVDYTIESSVGRIAQMIVKNNVGDSGYFARILKLNNMDTIIHPDPHYDCCTKNLQQYEVKNKDMLLYFENSYYRELPFGPEKLLTINDTDLIGRTIYLRTPMTCASHARGEGICYKCYGDLAYVNSDINAGVISSELMSAILTQMMLSAKHLLESKILELIWCNEFSNYFQVDYNTIKVRDDLDTAKMKIRIDPENIDSKSEFGEGEELNEFITRFELILPDGTAVPIYTMDENKMYITIPLNEAIRQSGEAEDGMVVIPLDKLEDEPLFVVELNNNELSRLLDAIRNLINRKATIEEYDRHTLLQKLIETLIEGGMYVMGVHVATILSNLIFDVEDDLEKPDWSIPNQEYQIFTLNQSLNHRPITISLSYEKIDKMLYNPLTFRKHGPSFMDLFFQVKPQDMLRGNIEITEAKEVDGLKRAIVFEED